MILLVTCPYCAEDIPVDARVCPFCVTARPAPRDRTETLRNHDPGWDGKCLYCAETIPRDAYVCPYCASVTKAGERAGHATRLTAGESSSIKTARDLSGIDVAILSANAGIAVYDNDWQAQMTNELAEACGAALAPLVRPNEKPGLCSGALLSMGGGWTPGLVLILRSRAIVAWMSGTFRTTFHTRTVDLGPGAITTATTIPGKGQRPPYQRVTLGGTPLPIEVALPIVGGIEVFLEMARGVADGYAHVDYDD